MQKMLKEIFGGLKSLGVGMSITLREFFKPNVTERYPRTAPTLPPNYRGPLELVRDPESGQSLCIACQACAKGCPSDCILIEGEKKEGEKKKSATKFLFDYSKCSICGSCVEVCPTDAIQYSRAYNIVSSDKKDFYMDLLKKLQDNQPSSNEQAADANPSGKPEERA